MRPSQLLGLHTYDPAAVRLVADVLNDDELCEWIRDSVRLGREGTLEELDPSSPKFQRGQMAYLKICNQLRKIMGREGWQEEHPDNQQCFIKSAPDGERNLRIVYFAGRLSEGQNYFKVNPKGKQAKLDLAGNQEQLALPFEEFQAVLEPESEERGELTFFAMSCWDWVQRDDAWRIRIRTWLAFCDVALNRRGNPQEEDDESRFSRTRVVAYRELDDYFYGGPAPIPDGPAPIVTRPQIMELSDLDDEMNAGRQ